MCVSSQSWGLPKCQGNQNDYWHNCFGTQEWEEGTVYMGEYKNNKKNGQGTIIYGNRSKYAGYKYVGQWKDGKYHGQDIFT